LSRHLELLILAPALVLITAIERDAGAEREAHTSRARGYSVLCYPSDVKTSAPSTSAYAVNMPPAATGTSCGGSYYGATSCVTGLPKTTYVRGYYRKDGTYVRPYYRSKRY